MNEMIVTDGRHVHADGGTILIGIDFEIDTEIVINRVAVTLSASPLA